MIVTQKTRYTLRAVFELARKWNQGPVKILEIARRQSIPPRFLEVILSQLKQTGIVDSRRGAEGGYFLVRDPRELTVGEVVRFAQGPDELVECLGENPKEKCLLREDCVFLPMWEQVSKAMNQVYDSTTFHDLVERDLKLRRKTPDYAI